jgi:hypothetical protein
MAGILAPDIARFQPIGCTNRTFVFVNTGLLALTYGRPLNILAESLAPEAFCGKQSQRAPDFVILLKANLLMRIRKSQIK